MKKLALLIITMMMMSTAFSQKDMVTVPRTTVQKLIKDVIAGDSLREEIGILKTNLTLYKQNNDIKDQIIIDKNQQISIYKVKEDNLNSIVGVKDEQLTILTKTNTQLAHDLKKEKRHNIFNKIISGLAFGALGYLYIIK